MRCDSVVFEVYETGPRTVVGFGSNVVVDVNVSECREALSDLVRASDSNTLVIDLAGLPYIPSGIIGMLVALNLNGIDVRVRNPSDEFLDVMRIARLEDVLSLDV